MTLSPVKKGRKALFFDGLLSDETSKIRLVGFQGMQQRKLDDYHQKNIPVELANCEVKPARQGEGYEVMLKSSTVIKQSPKKLDVASLMTDIATVSKTVTLSSLESLDVFQKVTVNIKVVELKDETEVRGRVKRDVSVADGSGTARVSVWEGNVNVMGKDRSYIYILQIFLGESKPNTTRDVCIVRTVQAKLVSHTKYGFQHSSSKRRRVHLHKDKGQIVRFPGNSEVRSLISGDVQGVKLFEFGYFFPYSFIHLLYPLHLIKEHGAQFL